jgi:hypothetical protein
LILGSNNNCHYFFSPIKSPLILTLQKLIYKFTGIIFTPAPANSAKANPTRKCCPVALKNHEIIQKPYLQTKITFGFYICLFYRVDSLWRRQKNVWASSILYSLIVLSPPATFQRRGPRGGMKKIVRSGHGPNIYKDTKP